MSEDDSHSTKETNGNHHVTGSRRGFLRASAGAIGLGQLSDNASQMQTSETVTAEASDENPPWAPRSHDHRKQIVYVPDLEAVTGVGTANNPFQSASGTAGMQEAFQRLNEVGGGVIYYPSGYYGDGTTAWEIDLANYDNLRNNWAIYGDGLESSRIRCGSDTGDGIRIHDSTGTAMFYTELVGVRFEGSCAGFTFIWGSENLGDAYNSCWSRFSTANTRSDGQGACQLNFVLNSYHYGVHNSAGGVGVEMRRVQFSGIEGSFSSGESKGDVALRLKEYSFANHFRYLNIEATYNGIHIPDSRAIYNIFQNAYFANVRGTAVIQDVDDDGPRFPASAEQGTYFHNPFVAGAIETIVEHTGGTLYVDGSSKKWPSATQQTFEGDRYGGSYRDAAFFEYEPLSSAPKHKLGRTALADGESWDPDGDGQPELVISNGTEWIELTDLASSQ
ncbi:hypothetical protein SAMN04487948_11774 [Halogranum amylolyticum]|uniref:Pectate lyase superfamily protein n=1 Tax=Halogranum amylolyticum TaxID=660520 RepID=A0A1H8VKY6_9EURY|nr:hypothetical protein [Halogranum amylolyticum]SEP16003.1 hypothetical protein SAMN04487948_11774 [Halogranum amylolyticum]